MQSDKDWKLGPNVQIKIEMKKLDLKRKWVKVEIPSREVVNVKRTKSKGQKLEYRRSKPRPSKVKVAKKHESMATTGGQSLNLSKNTFPNAKEILDILSNLFSKCQPHCEVCGNHIIQLTQHLLTKHADCINKNPVSVPVAHPTISASVIVTKVQNTDALFRSNANLTTDEHQDEVMIGVSDCDSEHDEIKIEYENDGNNDSWSECEIITQNIILNPQPDAPDLNECEELVLKLAREVAENVEKDHEIETQGEMELDLSKNSDCPVTFKDDPILNNTTELPQNIVRSHSNEYLNIIDPNTEHTLDVTELTLLAETATATTEPSSKIDRINGNPPVNPIIQHEHDTTEQDGDSDPDYEVDNIRTGTADSDSENLEGKSTKIEKSSRKSKVKGRFICTLCPEVYSDRRYLNRHLQTDHKDVPSAATPFICNFCSSRFSSMITLHVHMKSILLQADQQSICHLCKEGFGTITELSHHVKRFHSGQTNIHHVCRLCHQIFGTESELQNHIEVCQLRNVQSQNRSDEKKNRELLQCEICEKHFCFHTGLTRHMKNTHGECNTSTVSIEFCCEKCGKVFPTKLKLSLHLKTHNPERPFICEVSTCGKRFRTSRHLRDHMATHQVEREFMCTFCGRFFKNARHLMLHTKSIHEGPKLRCTKCMKAYATEELLAEHWRDHEGRKPYECPKCHKCFAKKKLLTSHIKVHTAGRPHECEYCHKSFNLKGTLDTHLKIHSGVKPFKCGDCQKCFLLPFELRIHRSRIHKDK